VLEQENRPGWYDSVFYVSHAMMDNYSNYRDVVFVNRRLQKTRFSRHLYAFCGVNSQGKSVLFAIALLSREDETTFQFLSDSLMKAFGPASAPKVVIVEKCSPLKSTLLKAFNCKVLYCSTHYQRCIRHYFDQTKPS